ncbi:hypothetical protein C4546_00890 [Candidatus Parcubacteria bacterium]|jgi:hypothetical protein|nr:MAG: hypothetical protein C4546_00890 [Candidatus Parcubacteria bacterium]
MKKFWIVSSGLIAAGLLWSAPQAWAIQTDSENPRVSSVATFLPLGRVLGEATVKPTIKPITLTKGVYKFKVGTKTYSLKPFNNYSGAVMARQINFGTKLGSVYLFIPQGAYSKAIINYYLPGSYSQKRELYVFGTISNFKGWNASISVEAYSHKVYIALGTKGAGASARVMEITSKGLRQVNNPTVAPTESKGPVLVQFLKLYPLQNGLVTLIKGNTATLKVWKYNGAKNRYDQDPDYDLSKIKIQNEKISL